jgi:hypothetical protein
VTPGGITAPPVATAVAVVGAAGAVIDAGTGEVVSFKAGTFSVETNVSLTVYARDSLPPAPGGYTALSHGIELQPSGVTFSPPAVITFSYVDGELAGADPSTLGVWVFQDGAWQFLGGTVDPAAHTVTISVSHFTLYALMAGAPRTLATQHGALGASRAPAVGYGPQIQAEHRDPLYAGLLLLIFGMTAVAAGVCSGLAKGRRGAPIPSRLARQSRRRREE